MNFFCAIYGIKVHIITDSEHFLSLIKNTPRYFVPGGDDKQPPDFTIRLLEADKDYIRDKIRRQPKAIFYHRRVRYYQCGNSICLGSPQDAFFFNVNFDKGKVEGIIYKGIGMLSFFFLFGCLTEVLFKEKNIFSMWGVSLARAGKSVILLGAHGSGKTTSALILLKSGFEFLGDDWLFFSYEGKKIKNFCLPLHFRVRKKTVRYFPELGLVKNMPYFQKEIFRIEKAFPDCFVTEAEPRVILFPEIRSSGTGIEKMSRKNALIEILPRCFITSLFGRQLLERNFKAVCRLVEQTDNYRLYLSDLKRDIKKLPVILEKIL